MEFSFFCPGVVAARLLSAHNNQKAMQHSSTLDRDTTEDGKFVLTFFFLPNYL